jgi:SAM-dependent methyltransferase
MPVLKTIKSLVPKPIKKTIRRCQYWAIDLFRDSMVPPEGAIYIGHGNFVKTGNEFLEFFKRYGGLEPTSRVLDVGSGQGRMALPLTEFLAPSAQYVGIEIVPEGVRWCRKKYRQFPQFRFLHADIYNKTYNPRGKIQASRYRFPLEDESFDFVFLTSVFTHMCPDDVQHYLREIARCMKPGGRCLITFFLLNETSLEEIRAGRSTLPLQHKAFDICLTVDAQNVEAAIAYPEEYVLDAFGANGLSLVGGIHYGNWVPRKEFLSYQDILVAEKPVK